MFAPFLFTLKFCFSIQARLCQSVVMGLYYNSLEPENNYVLSSQAMGWKILEEISNTSNEDLFQLWNSATIEWNKFVNIVVLIIKVYFWMTFSYMFLIVSNHKNALLDALTLEIIYKFYNNCMGSSLKLLQINLNHCKPASSLLNKNFLKKNQA